MRPYTLAERVRNARAKYGNKAAPLPILQAWRIAKSEAADYRLERLMSEADSDFQSEFGSRDSIARYQFDNGRELRIELEYVNDDSPSEWETEPDSLESLYQYFRKSKLGRRQAREAAAETLESQKETHEKKERGDYYSCGVVVRVYWRGELVADESLWGIIHESEDDTYSTVREVISQALSVASDAIRAEARATRSWASQFNMQPLSGYQPEAR